VLEHLPERGPEGCAGGDLDIEGDEVILDRARLAAITKLNLDVNNQQEQPAPVAQTWVTSVGG
jgi:hypothetical protein